MALIYDTGTVTATNNSADIAFVGSFIIMDNAKPGDEIFIDGGYVGSIKTIDYPTQTGTIAPVYNGTTGTGKAFSVRRASALSISASEVLERTNDLLNQITVYDAKTLGLLYRYDNDLLSEEPDPRTMKWNDLNPEDVTELYFSKIDDKERSVVPILNTIEPLAKLIIRSVDTVSYLLVRVDAVVDEDNYRKLEVTYLGHEGVFFNTEQLVTNFNSIGLVGPMGPVTPEPSLVANLGLGFAASAGALTIRAKQKDGTTDLASAPNDAKIAFPTTDGAYVVYAIDTSWQITIPSGATLGLSNGSFNLYLYAYDSAGTIRFAVSGTDYGDMTIRNVTMIGGGSSVLATVYGPATASNVRLRRIARLSITEAAIGTWTSSPTAVYPSGERTAETALFKSLKDVLTVPAFRTLIGALGQLESVKTNDYTVLQTDVGKTLVANKATAITFNLTAAATLGSDFIALVKNIGVGTLTIDPNSAELIDGASTVTLATGQSMILVCNGTEFRTIGMGQVPASQAEAEAGTSNTTVMTPLRTAQAIAQLAPLNGKEAIFTNSGSITAAHKGYIVVSNKATAIALELAAAATLGAAFMTVISSIGAGDTTLTINGGAAFDNGATSIVLAQGQSLLVTGNGTTLRAMLRGGAASTGGITPVRFSFIGNGTAGPYSLGFAPASAQHLFPFPGGELQDDFTTSGSSLTFGFPIESGVEVIGYGWAASAAGIGVSNEDYYWDVTDGQTSFLGADTKNPHTGAAKPLTVSPTNYAAISAWLGNGIFLRPTEQFTYSGVDFLLTDPASAADGRLYMRVQTPLGIAVPATESVDNTMLKDMAQATVKGRASGAGTGDPQDLTPAQARAIVQSAWRGVRVKKSAMQAIVNATNTPVTFNQEDYDTDAAHDTSVNNTRITIPAGVSFARFGATLSWASNSTGVRVGSIYRNGTVGDYITGSFIGSTAFEGVSSFESGIMPVTPGDYFEVNVYQTSGGDLNIATTTRFWMEIIQ